LQGNKDKAYTGGWTTWYPLDKDSNLDFPTAMTRIVEEVMQVINMAKR